MKFLIPTAKEMATTEPVKQLPLVEEAQAVLDSILTLDSSDLAKAYKIKPDMAEKEWQRWQDIATGNATYYPAIQLFNGLMYRQIKRDKLSEAEEKFLNANVFITSSFYGIIPANYPIAEHRLDFNTPLKVDGKSLKSLWKRHYDDFVSTCNQPIVSLLSSEFEQVFSGKQREKLILVDFFEETSDGILKKHSTISKKARGHFISAVVSKQVKAVEKLTQLTFADFHYRADLSTEKKITFVKKV